MLSFRRYIILFLITLSSCNSHKEEHDGDILRIVIPDTKEEERTQLYASDFISDIEYVSLETQPQCLIGEFYDISISENYILVYSSTEANCFLFSRNGKFIRKIGQRGNGPEEYVNGLYLIKIDEKSGVVFLMGVRAIYSYRITGEFIKKLDLSELYKKVGVRRLFNEMHWKDDLFCASGDEAYSFVIFSLDGEIVKSFPNYIKKEFNLYSPGDDFYYFTYKERIYIKEIKGDTLFMVNDQLDFVPELVLDLYDKGVEPPYYKGLIRSIFISDKYLFMHGTVFCLFEKDKKKLSIIKHDPSIIRERTISNESIKMRFYGLTNDIDGGLAFFPFEYFYKIHNDNQFVRGFQSYELKKYLTDEYLSTRKVKNPEAHKRLKKLLADLDEDDNPVIMIATVK